MSGPTFDADGDGRPEIATSVEVAVPVSPDEPVSLTADGVDVLAFAVELPAEANVAQGTVAPDGTVVHEATAGGASIAAHVLADGSARLMTVTQDASGPHGFTYTFADGVTPQLLDDGSIGLVHEADAV